jgi:hypothetical protein
MSMTIEQGLSTAMTLWIHRGPVHNFRIQTNAIKETFQPVKGLQKIEEVCNVKQQLYAFRIKKALHDDGAITDTALLYNDNVFELPLAKQTKRKKF